MAKSIVEQILAREIETEHRGYKVNYKLPEYYEVDLETLMDEDKLIAFLKEKGVLLGTLHGGFRDDVISCRALGRPTAKDGKPVDMTAEFAKEAQVKITEHKPSEFTDPSKVKTTKTTKKAAAKAVEEAGRKMVISFAQAGTAWEMTASIMEGAGFKPAKYKEIYERALQG